MKNIINILLISVLILSSCVEPIDLTLNTEENVRLVVNAELTSAPKAHLVDLSLTTDYFKEGIADRAENAIVTISDGVQIETLTELEPGMYYTSEDYQGEENVAYTLKIEYNGKTYESTETMLPVAPLDSMYIKEWEEQDSIEVGFTGYDLYIHFQETSPEGDHYLFRMLINGEYDGGVSNWFFTNDVGVDGGYISDVQFFGFEAEPADIITFESLSTSKQVYENLLATMLETDWRGGLFDGAPANVPSNISNGAVGAFIVADIESLEVMVPE